MAQMPESLWRYVSEKCFSKSVCSKALWMEKTLVLLFWFGRFHFSTLLFAIARFTTKMPTFLHSGKYLLSHAKVPVFSSILPFAVVTAGLSEACVLRILFAYVGIMVSFFIGFCKSVFDFNFNNRFLLPYFDSSSLDASHSVVKSMKEKKKNVEIFWKFCVCLCFFFFSSSFMSWHFLNAMGRRRWLMFAEKDSGVDERAFLCQNNLLSCHFFFLQFVL